MAQVPGGAEEAREAHNLQVAGSSPAPATIEALSKIVREAGATYGAADLDRFASNADRWSKHPAELGEWLSKRLMVYTQAADHLILNPPAGPDGAVIVLRAMAIQMKTAVVIHEAMVRLKLKEAVPANSRAKVTGRPAHRGRPGRRPPVGG